MKQNHSKTVYRGGTMSSFAAFDSFQVKTQLPINFPEFFRGILTLVNMWEKYVHH